MQGSGPLPLLALANIQSLSQAHQGVLPLSSVGDHHARHVEAVAVEHDEGQGWSGYRTRVGN